MTYFKPNFIDNNFGKKRDQVYYALLPTTSCSSMPIALSRSLFIQRNPSWKTPAGNAISRRCSFSSLRFYHA